MDRFPFGLACIWMLSFRYMQVYIVGSFGNMVLFFRAELDVTDVGTITPGLTHVLSSSTSIKLAD